MGTRFPSAFLTRKSFFQPPVLRANGEKNKSLCSFLPSFRMLSLTHIDSSFFLPPLSSSSLAGRERETRHMQHPLPLPFQESHSLSLFGSRHSLFFSSVLLSSTHLLDFRLCVLIGQGEEEEEEGERSSLLHQTQHYDNDGAATGMERQN